MRAASNLLSRGFVAWGSDTPGSGSESSAGDGPGNGTMKDITSKKEQITIKGLDLIVEPLIAHLRFVHLKACNADEVFVSEHSRLLLRYI
jgi:hypothetical protein